MAEKIRPNTTKLIRTVLGSRRHPQQAFRSCLGILRLGILDRLVHSAYQINFKGESM